MYAETVEILLNRSNSSKKWFEFSPVTPTDKSLQIFKICRLFLWVVERIRTQPDTEDL